MLKKILQKLGFFKKNDNELNDSKSKTKENLKKKKKKKITRIQILPMIFIRSGK